MYYFEIQSYIISYVDDIITVGPQDAAKWLHEELSKKLFVKHLGELQTNRRNIAFFGRLLRRDHDGAHLFAPESCAGHDQVFGPRSGGRSTLPELPLPPGDATGHPLSARNITEYFAELWESSYGWPLSDQT